MDLHRLPNAPPTRLPSRKSPIIDFPTSPLLVLDEMLHFSHPQHPLEKVNLSDLFTCAGCKEFGSGTRFICRLCDFQLHDFCALAPPSLNAHPFHYQHHLSFFSKPVKGGIMKTKCDVCSKPTKGYSFRCNACANFQMHPSCAMLSSEVNFSVHPHPLRLVPINPNLSSADPGFHCGECKRKRSGKVYRCTVCDYHLHAVCAKDMVNGLHDNGIKAPDNQKHNMLGSAAKLAGQVMVEFIGGLIEGFGEGVGEVIVQSMTKSKTNPNPRVY